MENKINESCDFNNNDFEIDFTNMDDFENYEDDIQQITTIDDIIMASETIDNCIVINQVYQQLIIENLDQLQNMLEDNLEKQKCILSSLEEAGSATGGKRFKHLMVFCKPYFRDKTGFRQPANDDTRSKYLNQDYDAYSKPAKKWTEEDSNKLRNAVRATRLDKIMQPVNEKIKHLSAKFADEKTKRELRLCHKEIDKLKESDDAILFNGKIDDCSWVDIAVIFGETRNISECRLMWENVLKPTLNQSNWNDDEDEKLKMAVDKMNYRDWDAIADELQTNRLAIQCFERYQRNFNESLRKSVWTGAEDRMLFELINQCRIENFIPWHQISYYMDGRTTEQVIRRWYFAINPEVKHGRYSDNEDLMLLAGVARFGTNWKKIESILPGRTHNQCRDRYLNALDKAIKRQAWSLEDDRKLVELTESYGAKWSEIAKFFPGRTDAMISRRFHAIDAAQNSEVPTDQHPRTKCKRYDYRYEIYEKFLFLLNHDVMKANISDNSLELEKMASLINEADSQKLDAIIDKLKMKLIKDERKRKVLRDKKKLPKPKPDEGDLYFEQYFTALNSFNSKTTIGRPSNESDTEVIDLKSADESCLISRISPPTLTTMALYKSVNEIRDLVLPGVDKRFIRRRQSKDDWKDLAEIFTNLFFWPELLWRVNPTEDLDSMVDDEVKIKPKAKKKRPRFSNRKQKKPWIAESMKQRQLKKMAEREQEKVVVVDEVSSQPEEHEIETEISCQPPKPKRGRPFGSLTKKQKVEVPLSEIRRSSRVRGNKS